MVLTQNILSKRILEANEVSTLKPVRSKLSLIPQNIAQQYEVVPFDGDKMTLALLTTNTFSEDLKKIYEGLKRAWYEPSVYYTDKEGIETALARYQQLAQLENEEKQQKKEKQESKWVSAINQILDLYPKRWAMDPGDFLTKVLKYSFQAWASDLHLQVQTDNVSLRLRIDGVLQTVCVFDHNEYLAYLQKIKFRWGMKMNIASTPQDGRMSFEVEPTQGAKKNIDVRINTMPWLANLENLVMRFLDSEISISSFEEIGFRWTTLDQLNELLTKNEGIVLVTWPTGSGKTTTLYTMLQRLNTGKNKIITLEDPIEYKIDGIEQSQINRS